MCLFFSTERQLRPQRQRRLPQQQQQRRRQQTGPNPINPFMIYVVDIKLNNKTHKIINHFFSNPLSSQFIQRGAREPDRVAGEVHLQRPATFRVDVQVALLAALLVRLSGGHQAANKEDIRQHFPIEWNTTNHEAIANMEFHAETR